MPLDNFPFQIERGLEEDNGFYLSLLKASVIRPYTVDDTGLLEYFVGVSTVEGSFVVGDYPNDSDINILPIGIAIGISILAFVAVVVGFNYGYRHVTGQTLHDEELKKDQKQSKQEGMQQRREVAMNNEPSLCGTYPALSDAGMDGDSTTIQSLHLSCGNLSYTSFDDRLKPRLDMGKSKDSLRTTPGRSRSDSGTAMEAGERPAFRGMRPNTGRSQSESHLYVKAKKNYSRDNSQSDLRASTTVPAPQRKKEPSGNTTSSNSTVRGLERSRSVRGPLRPDIPRPPTPRSSSCNGLLSEKENRKSSQT
jgi:hypothetical protein